MIGRPVPALGVVVEEIDDDLCLLRLDSNDVVVLNQTASDVWLLVADGMQTAEIVATLAASYGVAAAVIADDVTGVLDDLEQRGFVSEQL